ncbi:MAG: hypothetical protein Q4F28_13660 [Eubacteriales bacterium]|nr:hypothetical protein [Eubacteriales bacterium]
METVKETSGKKTAVLYYGLPVLGTLFCLWYIKRATCDIVYTDYIRLVNSYLPDVWNPEKFFVPDVLTRIPIHYLGRIINVELFGYSTTFDMALGAIGLGLSGLVLGVYCRKQKVGLVWFAFLMFLLFGLDKWEMLTNGTGWGHFMAFAGFYYHYLVFDRVLYGHEKKHDRVRLLVLPFMITLGMAGPYCAVYSVVMVLAYGAALVMRCRDMARGAAREMRRSGVAPDSRFWLAGIISVIIPLLLYMWSNSYAIEDHAGAVDIGLMELVGSAPSFFPRFLLKSLASMVVGGETLTNWIADGVAGDGTVYLIGGLLAAGYLFALALNWKYRLYERTLLPLMMLFAGMGNHGIVLISRYIFVKENYGMSSRYALQYQAGILGIVLTFALVWKCRSAAREGKAVQRHVDRDVQRRTGNLQLLTRMAAVLICLVLLVGHGYTNYVEWKMAPYREAYGRNIEAVAVQFESVSDEVLRKTFDYRTSRPDSGAKVRSALTILKENGWNVFGRSEE